jgi:glycosyltransferase involved in cell wall biosynthesis
VDEICSELSDKYQAQFDIDVLYTSHFDNYEVGVRRYNKLQVDLKGRADLIRVVRTIAGSKAYDVIVVPQIEPTVMCWIACLGLNRRFVVHLHGNPRLERRHLKAKLLFLLMKTLVLPRLVCVFGTSPKQLNCFNEMFPSKVPRRWVPNPVRQFESPSTRLRPVQQPVTFVNVGRFSYQKGQDILIRAFSELYAVRKHVALRVVGYGVHEPELRDTIRTCGLEEVVSVEYQPDNPESALSASDVYVSTSRWEGWSLAICEALRFGLPVIATDCDFGPSEILTDPRLGLLVPLHATDELVEAMLYYCDNLHAETAHSDYRKTFVDKFSVEQVVHVHADALRLAASG